MKKGIIKVIAILSFCAPIVFFTACDSANFSYKRNYINASTNNYSLHEDLQEIYAYEIEWGK